MQALHAIASRRSVRSFKSDPVSRETLVKIIEAGRLAPTARNVQPWEFIVVTEPARRRQIAALTDHGKFMADAPAVIVVLCRDTKYYLEDGCAATQSLLLAATALGLGSCWVAGDKKAYAPQIVATCGAPEEMKLVSLIAVGVAADIPKPSKRPVEDVLHWETF